MESHWHQWGLPEVGGFRPDRQYKPIRSLFSEAYMDGLVAVRYSVHNSRVNCTGSVWPVADSADPRTADGSRGASDVPEALRIACHDDSSMSSTWRRPTASGASRPSAACRAGHRHRGEALVIFNQMDRLGGRRGLRDGPPARRHPGVRAPPHRSAKAAGVGRKDALGGWHGRSESATSRGRGRAGQPHLKGALSGTTYDRLMSDSVTADRPGRPGWVSQFVHFPVTRIVLYLGGIAVALWILRLTARGLAAKLGAWWPAGVANVVLPILAVHFVYRGITRALERGGPPLSSPCAALSATRLPACWPARPA